MRYLLLATLVLASLAPRAQEASVPITALPFLGVPAVVELGGATVGRLTLDPRAALQNPAAVGLAARDAMHAVGGAPTEDWFGDSRYGVGVSAWSVRQGALAGGLAVGAGTMRGTQRTLADGSTYASSDQFRSLTVGMATTGAFRVAAGATGRYVTSTDVPVWDGSAFHAERLRGVTFDGGVLATADVAALAGHPQIVGTMPALEVTAGYAQTHMGGAIQYSGFDRQSLPRLGALGWSAQTGIDIFMDGKLLRLVNLEVAFGAERLLATEENGTTRYAHVTGGLPLGAALRGTGDARTTGRRGIGLSFAETVSLSWGRFDGWGYDDAQTRHWEIGTAGAMRWLSTRTPGALSNVLQRTDFRLGQTTVWAATPRAETRTVATLILRR